MDARFFWFPAIAAILSAVLIGLGPGLRAAQMAPYFAMKGGPASFGTRPDSSRSLLIVAQVALSMTVLVGAGLLVRTMQKLLAQDFALRNSSCAVDGCNKELHRQEWITRQRS